MTPEGKVKAKVNRRMRDHFGTRLYRFMPVQNGMGAPSLDYLCCVSGLFVAIETKVPGKHMTPRQIITRDEIEMAGGLVFEIHDDAEIDTMIAQIELHLHFAKTPTKVTTKAMVDELKRRTTLNPNTD